MIARKLLRRCTPEFVKIAIRSSATYKRDFGHYPNLLYPRTFTEKIQRRKVFDRDPRLPVRADKVLVKNFVASKIGPEHVIPTLWHGTELPPRAQRPWPRPFVMKANHGSGWNLFVRDEREHDWDGIEGKAKDWMAHTFGGYAGEWLYSQIEPQLLVEPFISEVADLPVDYKLWVFRGKVEFVQVDVDREHGHKRMMFDADWNRLEFSLGYPTDPRPIERPASLDQMISFAQALAEDLPFVRVDFYEIANKPLFGEMTFYPGSGLERFTPDSYNRVFGELMG